MKVLTNSEGGTGVPLAQIKLVSSEGALLEFYAGAIFRTGGGDGDGGRRRRHRPWPRPRLPHQHCVAPAGDLAMRGTSERPAAEVCNDSVIELVAMCGSRLVPLCLPTPL